MSYNEELKEQKKNKAKGGPKRSYSNASPIFIYHNISPTKEQKSIILEWSRESSMTLDALNDVVNHNYNVSIKYSSSNDCFISSVTCMDRESINYAAVATAYASIPDRALVTVLWFVSELWGLDKAWPKTLLSEPDW